MNLKRLNDERENIFVNKLANGAISAAKLAKMELSPLENIIAPWLKAGSIGFIFGKHGIGKSWFAWDMAICVSKGEDFGPWRCTKPWRTLYVDGEMPLKSMQDRLKLLEPNPAEELYLVSHEDMVEAEITLDLCKKYQQEWILKYCLVNDVKVVFLDSLSYLCPQMEASDASAHKSVLRWLLLLNWRGIATVVINNANQVGNEMRGSTHFSDAADWIMRLSLQEVDEEDRGKKTAFCGKFIKNRYCPSLCS
jgi:hypothetical protein